MLAPAIEAARMAVPWMVEGRVAAVRGLTILAPELPAPVGALAEVETLDGPSPAEVVGFTADHTVLMPLGTGVGVRAGARVRVIEARQRALVGSKLMGRVVDALGEPIDGGGPVPERVGVPLRPAPVSPLAREPIRQPMRTGVRAIDLMTPLGRGQRVGVFAGPGVGKSTLMSQIARSSDADVNVIALIGERGREVREFIEDALGPEGLWRSIVVVATGDESPPMRVRAALFACSAAEYMRSCGKSVMLMMDSVTRFCHAQRQIGLSIGEPPATKGYTPSVFGELPRMLERAGSIEGGGSVTGLYTILVEGDDMSEPIADAARGILDGHLLLSRKLAELGHFPAIDPLGSVSRVAGAVADQGHLASRQFVGRLLAKHREVEDLVQIGAYARGSDPEADVAIAFKPAVDELFRQGGSERRAWATDREAFIKLAMQAGDELQRRVGTGGGGGGSGGNAGAGR